MLVFFMLTLGMIMLVMLFATIDSVLQIVTGAALLCLTLIMFYGILEYIVNLIIAA